MNENEARGAEAANQDGETRGAEPANQDGGVETIWDGAAGTGGGLAQAGSFMGKPEAVKRLLDMMKRKSMTPEDVEALTMGVRNLVRRHAQRQKNRARRRLRQAESAPGGAGESGQFFTPKAALDVVLENPPMDTGKEA